MRFEEALSEMRKGKKVIRQGYVYATGKKTFYYIDNNRILYNTGICETNYDCPFTQTEIFAEDWEVVDE